ncbi:MAG: FliH/SctL family protein [Actinomycetes bacterium]|uniref:Unannotated protein n=1 Tax=freshwater metagenome TaxID=449393 RepID=A0A6J6EPK4_9ZZZZ
MDQSRLERTRRASLTTRSAAPVLQPLRFEPPKLATTNGGRMARDPADEAALAEAYAAGRREAEAELAVAVDAHRRATEQQQYAAAALANALDRIEHVDLGTLHDFQQQVLSLAVALAEELVGRELQAFDDVVLANVERALSLVPERGDVVLRVHPTDLAGVLEGAAMMGHRAGDVQVVADPSVQRGGCVASCGPLQVDAQFDGALARLREAFAS